MVDLPADSAIVELVKAGEGKLLVVGSGHGLVVDMQVALANAQWQQVLNAVAGAGGGLCAGHWRYGGIGRC